MVLSLVSTSFRKAVIGSVLSAGRVWKISAGSWTDISVPPSTDFAIIWHGYVPYVAATAGINYGNIVWLQVSYVKVVILLVQCKSCGEMKTRNVEDDFIRYGLNNRDLPREKIGHIDQIVYRVVFQLIRVRTWIDQNRSILVTRNVPVQECIVVWEECILNVPCIRVIWCPLGRLRGQSIGITLTSRETDIFRGLKYPKMWLSTGACVSVLWNPPAKADRITTSASRIDKPAMCP